MQEQQQQQAPRPWWTYGHVWLVIAGPLAVVLAGFATLYLALTRPDPVLARQEPGPAVQGVAAPPATPMTPALQARNHAATAAPARETGR